MGFIKDLLSDVLQNINQQGVENNEYEEEQDMVYSADFPFSRREERIQNEIMMIAPRFKNGGIEVDEENFDYLIINHFALPSRWAERWCRLMVIFPQSYPDTPPIGFYLNKKFKLKRGTDEHFTGKAYYGAPDLQESGGWFWYCCHLATGAWCPQLDYKRGDNLFTYLNMVRESLTNDF